MNTYKGNYKIAINDDDENLIKVLYLINIDSLGIFNLHTGQMIYKIKFKIDISNEYHYDNIYSLNYCNNDYICLSYGNVFETGVRRGHGGAKHRWDKRYHSMEIINLKEEKMKQVLKLADVDKSIFVKTISHPKYGYCLLTQDDCGEIKLIQIKLK